jgi:hypothetical protein
MSVAARLSSHRFKSIRFFRVIAVHSLISGCFGAAESLTPTQTQRSGGAFKQVKELQSAAFSPHCFKMLLCFE